MNSPAIIGASFPRYQWAHIDGTTYGPEEIDAALRAAGYLSGARSLEEFRQVFCLDPLEFPRLFFMRGGTVRTLPVVLKIYAAHIDQHVLNMRALGIY